MGRTIEDCIRYLADMRKTYQADSEVLSVAVETMQKYQKIEHIINDVPYLDKDEYKIASIKEIINGNDD